MEELTACEAVETTDWPRLSASLTALRAPTSERMEVAMDQ